MKHEGLPIFLVYNMKKLSRILPIFKVAKPIKNIEIPKET